MAANERSLMADRYNALSDFDYPEGSANMKRALRGDMASITGWRHVKKGALLDAPDRETLASWLANGFVEKAGAKAGPEPEEVTEDGL